MLVPTVWGAENAANRGLLLLIRNIRPLSWAIAAWKWRLGLNACSVVVVARSPAADVGTNVSRVVWVILDLGESKIVLRVSFPLVLSLEVA